MDYEPFDFDKLDRLLGDYSELDDPEWVALRRRSNQATQPEPQQPAQEGYADTLDPYSGWPEPETPPASQPAPRPRRTAEARPHRTQTEAASHSARRNESARRAKRSKPDFEPDKATAPQRRRKTKPEPELDPDTMPASYSDDAEFDDTPPKKKHHFFHNLLIFLLLLAGLLFAILKFNIFQPTAETGTLGARKTGASVILIAGTDDGGSRTDTMMLAYVNAVDGQINLISIPRDTLVYAQYNVPKLNGCYGINGSGKDGMEALMDKVQAIIGFRPDGYVLTNLDSFVDLVDMMGGVTFNVPQDMYYNDPSQNLFINLTAGEQTLNGEQAMGLVRFRSGYASADLQRMSVQRDFLSTAMKQWAKPSSILKAPQILTLAKTSLTTDLSTGNLIWLAGALLRCNKDEISTETLPGGACWWSGGSYYALNATEVAAMINASCNPYQQEITAANLNIRTP